MSYDLMVYAANGQMASRAAVASALRTMGWDVAFLNGYRTMLPATGSMLDGKHEVVVGWPSDPALSSKVRRVVEARDVDGLDRLHEGLEVGSCELYAGNVNDDPDGGDRVVCGICHCGHSRTRPRSIVHLHHRVPPDQTDDSRIVRVSVLAASFE